MAGHIAGLGYSQRMDINGDPLAGAKLYIYSAGTSTPATVYEDYSLSIEHSHPIVADAAGIIPMFWVDDGTYRVRLTDSAGNEVFDDDNIVALGPSSGTGGGGSSVASDAIFTTGDVIWVPASGQRTGWVRANGRTIGSSASGATERANSDTEELFTYFWNNFDNTLCAVSGGRGANAAADFAANKTIAILDMRGRCAYGMDDMGSSAASVISGATSAGAAHGQESKTIAQANLPNVNFTHSLTGATHTHSFSATTSSDGAHTHTYTQSNNQNDSFAGGGTSANKGVTSAGTSSDGSHTHTVSGTSGASGALTVSGTVSSGGSGTALATLSPGRVGTWHFKL